MTVEELADRLRVYASEIRSMPGATIWEAGYGRGLRKAADLIEAWSKEEE